MDLIPSQPLGESGNVAVSSPTALRATQMQERFLTLSCREALPEIVLDKLPLLLNKADEGFVSQNAHLNLRRLPDK